MGDRLCSSVVLDVGKLPSDVRTVDTLARLQLALRREGRELVLVGASPDLTDLIELAGLSEILRPVRNAEP
jgi:anti-anti-sigma regulatory factor